MGWFSKFFADGDSSYEKLTPPGALNQKLTGNLLNDLVTLRALCSNTADLMVREKDVCGVSVAMVLCEGMVSTSTFSTMVGLPVEQLVIEQNTPQKTLQWMRYRSFLALDQSEVYTYEEIFRFIMSGFVLILIDGISSGIVLGLQGFQYRSISEPMSEVNVRGSREGFVEAIRVNMSMVRRRLKSPTLKFELYPVGSKSQTDICLVYLTDVVPQKLLREVKYRLQQVEIDVVLESGYLQPFLEHKPVSLFTGVGVTERPDTLCAKINEGRIAILVDGTPFALLVPHLFNEDFQSFDDYAHRPYYATFIRWLKYFSFFLTILLPGIYVAVATFHPELLPTALLFNLLVTEQSMPFPIVIEALVIHLLYELMREAGLRLPRPIGHAVSIVGGLVIGDAAVRAGLIGAPMVMVVALTAISSFVVPALYEPVTILRFSFILIGGLLGIFGIALGLFAVFINLCAVNSFGVPSTSPTTPFSFYSMRDVMIRIGWKRLGKKTMVIEDLPGSTDQ